MLIRNTEFDFSGSTGYIMGILNVTPDSFSDGGRYNSVDAAVAHAREMIAGGADIIDIGAESTRPGHVQISIDEECARLIDIIAALRAVTDVPLSVDTYRAPVARAALAAGCDMINDIWGLTYDAEMAPLIAEAGCPVCIMHNRKDNDYDDFLSDWLADMRRQVAIAKDAGIAGSQIILDPGIGFAKSFDYDTQALTHLDDLCALGHPVLLGTSRKRVIGNLLDLPVDQRDEGTAATTIYGYLAGARIFRVHNVAMNRRVLDTVSRLEAIKHGQR
ncbi:MAG: dihydropteroate synthase [Peptococcaceae bacterium]|nr:dihydropteroate synthase [Peptococcaceae bacterium]